MATPIDIYKVSEVFVPGGIPLYTYYNRNEHELEKKLESAKDNLCKLVVVTGPTKSGKTVLVDRIYDPNETVWVDCGLIDDEESFWNEVGEQIGSISEFEEKVEKNRDLKGGGKAKIDLGLFKGLPIGARGDIEYRRSKKTTTTKKRNISGRIECVKQLVKENRAVVIDDFHYLQRSTQSKIIRALKAPISKGLPVIIIGIPSRKFDVVKIEREMTGRVIHMEIPPWSLDELESIPQVGFSLLNMNVSDGVVLLMCKEAIGSPHLIQDFCRELCRVKQIDRTTLDALVVEDKSLLQECYESVANNIGRSMFEKLKRGKRQRKDRKQRYLQNGGTTDIYGLILLALTEINPGTEAIEYETLRTHMKDLCKSPEDMPQAQETSRVLEYMSHISSDDEASSPVIDWDKSEMTLHVLDPFFSFYLKWGDKK